MKVKTSNMTPEEFTSRFIDFIKTKPDSDPIDMRQVSCQSQPGCILVQFAREELGLTDFTVGAQNVYDNRYIPYKGDETVRSIISWLIVHPCSDYLGAREILKKEKNLIP